MIPITDASFEDMERLESHEQFECGRRSIETCANINEHFEADGQPTSGDESIIGDVKHHKNGGSACKNKNRVRKPKKTAPGDKKFECIYCRQKYITKNSLSRHIIDHGIFSKKKSRAISTSELFY